MGIVQNKISREELGRRSHQCCQQGGFILPQRYICWVWLGDSSHCNTNLTATQAPKSSTRTEESICRNCGHDPNTTGGVVKTCIDCFLQGHSLCRFDYDVSSDVYFNKRVIGTCSKKIPVPRIETVLCALLIFKRDEVHGTGFGEYNLIHNNCEHFAAYCKTAKRVSIQIQHKDGLIVRMIAASLRSSS